MCENVIRQFLISVWPQGGQGRLNNREVRNRYILSDTILRLMHKIHQGFQKHIREKRIKTRD